MQPVMANIKKLRNDMKNKGWTVTAFEFPYNRNRYIVIVDLLADDREDKIWIVNLTFIDMNDENRMLKVKANSSSFNISVKEIRKFFFIKFSYNVGDLLKQFYKQFQIYVPICAKEVKNKNTKKILLKYINKAEKDEGYYLFKIFRNPKVNGIQRHRTKYNGDKTRLLRLEIYDLFFHDDTISFCYTDDPSLEKTNQELLLSFQNRNIKM